MVFQPAPPYYHCNYVFFNLLPDTETPFPERIRIDIMVEDLVLDFSIKNSVLSKETEENENGIGLENFRKRLDLNYKDNYTLEKSITDGWYTAHLRIPDLNKINNE